MNLRCVEMKCFILCVNIVSLVVVYLIKCDRQHNNGNPFLLLGLHLPGFGVMFAYHQVILLSFILFKYEKKSMYLNRNHKNKSNSYFD